MSGAGEQHEQPTSPAREEEEVGADGGHAAEPGTVEAQVAETAQVRQVESPKDLPDSSMEDTVPADLEGDQFKTPEQRPVPFTPASDYGDRPTPRPSVAPAPARPVVPVKVEPTHKRGLEDDAEFHVESVPPPELTKTAIRSRLRRIFQKRKDGSTLLDDQWNQMWLDLQEGGGRDELMAMFEKCGYSPELGCWTHLAKQILYIF